MPEPLFPLIGLVRHRLGTDGAGVTTLVAARGCPLRCRWCLNPQSWTPGTPTQMLTPQALYDRVAVDDLYFQATGGGVTFGGGEPLAHARFISAFRTLCADKWRLAAETCLNIPEELVRLAMACVDDFIVDIKDMNPAIYRRYTGQDNAQSVKNLRLLLEQAGPARVLVRVPHIPDFNTDADVASSLRALSEMGVQKIDEFNYIVRPQPGQNVAPQ